MPDAIKLLGDNLLVVPLDRPTRTPSGLALPDTVSFRPAEIGRGTVAFAGPGEYDPVRNEYRPPEVAPGAVVLYRAMAGQDVEIDGTVYRLLTVREIVGVLPPKESP